MRQELVARANMVYASPARGWPQLPATDITGTVAVPHALKGTADNAAVSELAGLSARSAAFGLASFGGDSSDGAVYIASQARAAFHHGESAKASLVPGRPSLHMTALAPRVRTPIKSARELAMKKAGAEVGIAKSAVFLPPAFSRSLIGERPGIVETTIDVILAEGTDLALQAGDASFGRSATAGPAVMRQVRMPRSPALPIEDHVNLETRRRTYVSLADASPPNSADKLLPLLAASSAATMWRHRWVADQSTDYEARFLLELLDSLDAGKIEDSAKANQLPSLQLRLRLRLWTDNPPDDGSPVLTETSATAALARTRILDAAFWLTIGKDQFQATKLAQTKALAIVDEEAIVPLVLNFDYVQASAIVALLQDPDPNIKATLNARLLPGDGGSPQDEEKPAGLKEGLPIDLTLPIGRIPAIRPALSVTHQSFFFADPAFDRMLATPTLSSQLNTAGGGAWLLAVDRVQYDLRSALNFAFFDLQDRTSSNVEAEVDFKLYPAGALGGPETSLRLIDDTAANADKPYTARAATIYTVRLDRLSGPGRRMPQPGDRIELRVLVKGGPERCTVAFTLAENVENPSPPAVYSVVVLDKIEEDRWEPRTLLHASAPAPDRTEFVDLLGDLLIGRVRRRAIFEWRASDFEEINARDRRATLVKTDSSGGAQLPEGWSDFVAVPPRNI